MRRAPATKRTIAVLTSLLLAACGDPFAEAQDAPAAAPAAAPGPGDLPTILLSPAFPRLSFHRPVQITNAGDGSGRLFVVEQMGRIRVFPNAINAADAPLFLDIAAKVRTSHNEEGLLALAFHPDYAKNRRFFVCYTASNPRRSVLSSLLASADDPNRADPASEEVILEVDQPYGNHNGATILFGADGFLYLSLGDGGWADDPHGHGQNLGTLLGSILRIDVDRRDEGRAYAIPADNPFVGRPGARGEIWAYGLRNVWRMSFDRATGNLWAGDVGQNRHEEIDLIVRGGNYGWNLREGMHPFRSGEPADPLIDPVIEYGRRDGWSVTGGHVYRGERNKRLRGSYLYADYVSGFMWALTYADGTVTAHRRISADDQRLHITSFGEDEAGELYVVTFEQLDRRESRGRVLRVVE
jgi:glucose/arabinose dehydrogenase